MWRGMCSRVSWICAITCCFFDQEVKRHRSAVRASEQSRRVGAVRRRARGECPQNRARMPGTLSTGGRAAIAGGPRPTEILNLDFAARHLPIAIRPDAAVTPVRPSRSRASRSQTPISSHWTRDRPAVAIASSSTPVTMSTSVGVNVRLPSPAAASHAPKIPARSAQERPR
jgi:hypothetical protein